MDESIECGCTFTSVSFKDAPGSERSAVPFNASTPCLAEPLNASRVILAGIHIFSVCLNLPFGTLL